MSEKNKDNEKIFSLDFTPESLLLKTALGLFKSPLEKVLDIGELNAIHSKAKHLEGDQHFASKLLDVMNINVEYDESGLNRIPAKGKLVIVANHPFGGIEGVILGALINKVRPDCKIMANYLLERIPELRDLFLFVNPFGSREATRQNLLSMKSTLDLLRNDGVFGVFPAGTVSHMSWNDRNVRDPEWADNITRIITKTESPVLPVFFCGHNGSIFQTAGLVHSKLRTLLLPRQFTNKQNTTIKVRFGKVIPFSKLKGFTSEGELTRYLRQRTYLLQSITDSDEQQTFTKRSFMDSCKSKYEPVIDPIDPDLLLQDISALDNKQLLLSNNDYDVFYGNSKQLPNILQEIGRLREVSFRATDEGTGKSVDLDEYDKHYMHIFVWHRENRELVGAYRLGRTDNILKKIGMKGLYTTTLFEMKPTLLDNISPALEMGRSFVSPKYQRSFAPLLLLWKGIGQYVVKYPKYKILFGPVSISNDYETSSRNLMVKFLTVSNFLPDMARLVKPKTPFKTPRKKGWQPPKNHHGLIDIDDISEVVSNIESDQKGVPILLKQYLKLGGKLLGFNLDPEFADALDGLILVDLTKTDEGILSRYMGKEGMDIFREYHATGKESKEKAKV
ncbi:MAG: lysophospholipid acyltransferase family protein [Balneolales bacterium]|nr:lysophospholipid acyltransferase family protein [Balneolales bacterium]